MNSIQLKVHSAIEDGFDKMFTWFDRIKSNESLTDDQMFTLLKDYPDIRDEYEAWIEMGDA